MQRILHRVVPAVVVVAATACGGMGADDATAPRAVQCADVDVVTVLAQPFATDAKSLRMAAGPDAVASIVRDDRGNFIATFPVDDAAPLPLPHGFVLVDNTLYGRFGDARLAGVAPGEWVRLPVAAQRSALSPFDNLITGSDPFGKGLYQVGRWVDLGATTVGSRSETPTGCAFGLTTTGTVQAAAVDVHTDTYGRVTSVSVRTERGGAVTVDIGYTPGQVRAPARVSPLTVTQVQQALDDATRAAMDTAGS